MKCWEWALIASAVVWVGCAVWVLATGCAPARPRDWCATGLDAWVEGGYGEGRSGARDVDSWGDASRSRGSGSDWSTRVGASVHWDLTGACWDYEEAETPAGPDTDGGGP